MEQILSIQSAVTLGFVGNNVAAPVITHLGHQPLLVNSVTLAAHPGYGLIAGGPTPDATFTEILDALPALNALANIGAVITGYLGAPSQINGITNLIIQWQAAQPKGHYVLDPVLGDNGRIYVDDQLVSEMRDQLLPLASFLTPNQFELELLAKQPVTDVASATAAARQLLAQNLRLKGVVATGISGCDGRVHDCFVTRDDAIDLATNDLAYEKRPTGIAGGGDLLTVIFTSWLAAGQSFHASFTAASTQAHAIIDKSANHLEIALLENLYRLTAIGAEQ
ncbi:MAG: pyridoxal kinase [Proteobacteria bacterium]|nr:pyridoxal kinase [Pseudomonadota bacterium]MDA0959617.1 pyridoxal kinase [Pseudomonadota bacterium]MDA1152532.1 pyridoxal kinase [Pseudomonadota bacterium]